MRVLLLTHNTEFLKLEAKIGRFLFHEVIFAQALNYATEGKINHAGKG